jgi:hypothetical protein
MLEECLDREDTHTTTNTEPWVSSSTAVFSRSLLQPQIQSSPVELWIKEDTLFLT